MFRNQSKHVFQKSEIYNFFHIINVEGLLFPAPECVDADCWNLFFFLTPPPHQEHGY